MEEDALAEAIASGAIGAALFDLLISKRVLTREEGIRCLDSARLGCIGITNANQKAREIIRKQTENLLRSS